jgi:hypothetical protein
MSTSLRRALILDPERASADLDQRVDKLTLAVYRRFGLEAAQKAAVQMRTDAAKLKATTSESPVVKQLHSLKPKQQEWLIRDLQSRAESAAIGPNRDMETAKALVEEIQILTAIFKRNRLKNQVASQEAREQTKAEYAQMKKIRG